jgi:hypothetical protein
MSEGSEDEGYEGSPLSPGAAAEGRGKAVWTQQVIARSALQEFI